MENTKKVTLEEIRRCSEELRCWNRWGQDDEVGTLNLATPEKVVEAAKLINKGETFALTSTSTRTVLSGAGWAGSTPSTP